MRLPASFYRRSDTVQVARELLGHCLVTEFEGQRTVGRIVETEAYRAPEDKACHAYGNRRTARTETMFRAGGIAYIYLCYGIHHLFNVVTGQEDEAHAVLIRGLEPLEGTDLMLQRRGFDRIKPQLTAGPGVLSKALGLHRRYDGTSLLDADSPIWIMPGPDEIQAEQIISGARIGVDYAEECAAWPWRFYLQDNQWVSKSPKN